MKMSLLTPAYYIENRLLVGGALAFCSAVVLQLIQIPPEQLVLSTSLTAALGPQPWQCLCLFHPCGFMQPTRAWRDVMRLVTQHVWGLWLAGDLHVCGCHLHALFEGIRFCVRRCISHCVVLRNIGRQVSHKNQCAQVEQCR